MRNVSIDHDPVIADRIISSFHLRALRVRPR
jgi:hypothetical protein